MTIRELRNQYASLDAGNIGAFIISVRQACSDPEVTDTDIRLYLDSLIDGFEPEGRRLCTKHPLPPEDAKRLSVVCKVLACQMLLLVSMRSWEALRERALLFLQYGASIAEGRYSIVPVAVKLICYRLSSVGLTWADILSAMSPDTLVYKFVTQCRFSDDEFPALQYPVRGTLLVRDGRMTISSIPGIEAGSEAFYTADDSVLVVSRNSRDERLRAGDRDDAEAVGEFASGYLSTLKALPMYRQARREPEDGDRVDIIIESYSEEEGCVFRMLDDDYPLSGYLEDEELVVGLTSRELENYIYEGDCICGARLIRDGEEVRFSIWDCYREYVAKVTEEFSRTRRCFEASVTHVRADINRLNWMTALGFGAVSDLLPGQNLKEGSICVMQMASVKEKGDKYFVNIQTPENADVEDPVRLGAENEDVLKGFVKTEKMVRACREQTQIASASDDLPGSFLERMVSILASCAHLEKPMESYRMLLVAAFLLRMTGNEEQLQALLPDAFWLRCRLCFAQGAAVPTESPYGELPAERKAILASLSAFSGPALEQPVEVEGEEVPALVEAFRLSQHFPDEIRASASQVRQKICASLGVSDAFREDGTRRKGKYGRVEMHTVEFKSSYVMSNDNHGADLDYQGRGQVFEAVCSFLNADGGVVYVGVNDDGDPILSEDAGITGDMAWLCANFNTIQKDRTKKLGHRVMIPDTLDHFILFLNSERELYFSESVQGLITIEATEDADAIRITVRPSEFEIAYLYSDKTRTDGVAYVRDGSSTRPMTNLRKRQRLMSLKSIDKEMDFVVTIQEAINQHRKLIFKDYASGNSGKVEDRHVVPINLFYNDENVYCYDLDARKPKQFRLHRIASIEPYGDEPYTLPTDMPRKEADVFRWVDGDCYHIRVRMEVGARNYLLEEYSNAKNLPLEEFYPDPESPDKWILDTHLHGLGAIRRFYLGLADKIEILDSEDSEALKEEIRSYVGKIFRGL